MFLFVIQILITDNTSPKHQFTISQQNLKNRSRKGSVIHSRYTHSGTVSLPKP
nr:MAG TPA: hypothetical protein [Caudoviricetes sp.]